MHKGYSVTVSRGGEIILTIERGMLSGQADLSKEDAAAIRDAGEHLIAFAGPEVTECFICGGIEKCSDDCALKEENAARDNKRWREWYFGWPVSI